MIDDDFDYPVASPMPEFGPWRGWFAWRPVRLRNGRWAWLRTEYFWDDVTYEYDEVLIAALENDQ